MNPEQWLSLKWNGGSTMSDRWLNQSKIIHVKGLTRSLSRDLGPYGIRVNSLNPGFVYTDMLAKTNLKTPERLEEIQNRTPLRGFAKEKDLGMAAAFLCSDAARFISGIDLVVDGGISSSFLL